MAETPDPAIPLPAADAPPPPAAASALDGAPPVGPIADAPIVPPAPAPAWTAPAAAPAAPAWTPTPLPGSGSVPETVVPTSAPLNPYAAPPAPTAPSAAPPNPYAAPVNPYTAPAAPAANPYAPAPQARPNPYAPQAAPGVSVGTGYAPGGYAPSPYAGYPMAPTAPKGLSVTSMVLGLVGFLFGPLFSIGAVITGHIAQRREPGGRPFWLTGIITGYVMIGIWLLIVVFYIIVFATVYSSSGY